MMKKNDHAKKGIGILLLLFLMVFGFITFDYYKAREKDILNSKSSFTYKQTIIIPSIGADNSRQVLCDVKDVAYLLGENGIESRPAHENSKFLLDVFTTANAMPQIEQNSHRTLEKVNGILELICKNKNEDVEVKWYGVVSERIVDKFEPSKPNIGKSIVMAVLFWLALIFGYLFIKNVEKT